MARIQFLDGEGTFSLEQPEHYSGLYLPLAGNGGLKSAVTPDFGGDSKLDQQSFLLEPVTIESLHSSRSTRNFWCLTEEGAWSAAGASAEAEARRFTEDEDESVLTAGFMYQTVRRTSRRYKLEAELTLFVPPDGEAEVLRVRVRNLADRERTVTAVAAVPLYGRSADNVRDHRNVTAMLHRIRTTERGVLVRPTMTFDERGHRPNSRIYYAVGTDGQGRPPAAFYPTVPLFIGEGGTFTHPAAVCRDVPGVPPGREFAGREAMGGLRFAPVTLAPGGTADYTVLLGVAGREEDIGRVLARYGSAALAERALADTAAYWSGKVNVRVRTGDRRRDLLLRWVAFQPFLRRIYGCSFLPHHDYGRGGRGWRDLWQDCLSLLLMDPGGVRDMLVANFGGVRMDGTNATIIGSGPGEFLADRNGIARVWMDHALWPLMTVGLYIGQTGDTGILAAEAPYFKDALAVRGTERDGLWREEDGSRQRTEDGGLYLGSVFEHLLLQHLTAFYEVGAHNILRLRGADWNDALDMAPENGESVAFTCVCAGNLRELAALARMWRAQSGAETAEVLAELAELLPEDSALYDSVERKNGLLAAYARRCRHTVSGRTVSLPLGELADRLDGMADWMAEHLRRQEWIEAGDGAGWFNSYYDNHGRPAEGITPAGVRMMLTGQVFAVMSGVADDAQTAAIVRAADRYLYRRELGGYRLNTDFGELKLDLGRMFGFAYGEKENGAVFSHMAVMYANALYRRGFVREGYKALDALAAAALEFDRSRIYPGIPEYFNGDGRGMYHYLTGAASWYLLTVVTQAFGVRGEGGDLVVEPRLVREQFDRDGRAGISLVFAGKALAVEVVNRSGADAGQYRIQSATLETAEGAEALPIRAGRAAVSRKRLARLPDSGSRITVVLE